jgi:large repetitive protein
MTGSGAVAVAYPLIQSSTPTYTAEDWSDVGGYAHIMAGSDYQPTNVNFAETLLQNRFDTTPLALGASAHATSDPVDEGGTTVLVATPRGGEGIDAYSWSALPPGCVSNDAPTLTCQPTQVGSYAPVVTVSDSAGDVASSDPVVLVVEPALNVSVRPSTPGSDVGGTLSFSASVSGGAPPYACAWVVEGIATTGTCAAAPASTATTGPVSANVSVTDATGATVNASSGPVSVNPTLGARITASNTSVAAGSPVEFTLSIAGGTGPFWIVWLAGSSPLLGYNGTTLTYVPAAAGTLSITARVVDATGNSVTSNTLSVTVNASSAPVGASNSGGASSDLDTPVFWVAIALAAVAGVEAVFLVAKSMPPRRP